MRLRSRSTCRNAATLIEAAIVLPVTLLLIFGLVVGGLGIFRYQEVAHLARLTARYAATHGGQYAQDNATAIQNGTLPNVNETYLTQTVMSPAAVAMDTSKLSATVSITTPSGTFDWDSTSSNGNRMPTTTVTQGNSTATVSNTVTVTVTYKWTPELYLVGPITLSSTSVMPMSY
ncbi:MAG TPA: TadE family protein [Gemmataceae bacterium]|nr:TadE family protein [Gemmataceae bacterium]